MLPAKFWCICEPVVSSASQISISLRPASLRRPTSDTGNFLQRAARLYEAYIVDQYCKVEWEHLQYIQHNQEELKYHLSSGFEDADQKKDVVASSIGKRVILPSSYDGCPWALHALYQDGIAITRKRGKADLFITMTANPHWPEIAAALLPGQKKTDRPDLITCVVKLKVRSLLDHILKNGFLGQLAAHMYIIECQKRGLPHVHILVIFADGYKLLSPMEYDHVICAGIPYRNADPQLYDIIAKWYMHGPCGDKNPSCACMKNGRCSNGYPKEFVDATINNEDGCPIYRQKNIGRPVLCREQVLDNRWVVPHVRALAKRYNSHINVEYCASSAGTKYLHEYIYKGFDHGDALMRDNANNKSVEFVEGRYICTSDGVWCLLGFDMHEQV